MAPGMGTPSSQVHSSQMHHTEGTMHGHHLTGQPPPHAPGMGEYGGYHQHHGPPLPARMGPPLGVAAAYHKVDPLPQMGMAYPHHYSMPMPHGMKYIVKVCITWFVYATWYEPFYIVEVCTTWFFLLLFLYIGMPVQSPYQY